MSSREKIFVTRNKKALHDYFILESMEAGIALLGTEVKSLRDHRANLKDSYAEFRRGELFLVGAHISPYPAGNINNHEPLRDRKLLLHKKEISRLIGKVKEKGLTLVPLSIYFIGGKAKIEIALAKGKKEYDKRDTLARETAQREIEKAFRARETRGR
ncbi:MAG: SsrA-binding protein SmpB [Actinobacteria bacterium]|nr:SsrA-binding protein SmpB [Actinomycetota bacterium]